MNITRNNYEIYFLDYYENSLSPEKIKELMDFLDANPDLKKEFAEFELISIKDDSAVTFPFKQNLKKNESLINSANYREYMIDFIENNLTPNKQEELNKYIQNNTALQKELEAFKRTRLIPDLSVSFPNKNKLKHYKFKPFILNTQYTLRNTIAIAASVAILIGLFLLLRTNNKQNNLAVTKNIKPEIISKHIPQNITLQKQTPENKSALAIVRHKTNKKVAPVHQPNPVPDLLVQSMTTLNMIKPIKSYGIATETPENIFPEKLEYQNQGDLEKFYASNHLRDDIASNNGIPIQIQKGKSSLQNVIVSGALAVVGEKSLPTTDPKIKRQKISSFWDVAFLATKAYDKIFNKDANLKEKFDDKGGLAYVDFSSELVDFEKKVNK